MSVQRAIKSWPLLLGCSTGKLKLMVEQFGELGIQNKKLGMVIAKSPQLLLRKPRELLQVGLYLFLSNFMACIYCNILHLPVLSMGITS